MASIGNRDIAAQLRRMAEVLDWQLDNGFRATAYRKAAEAIDELGEPAEAIWRRAGIPGLMEIEHVGRGIAAAIGEMIASGRWTQLDRLTGELEPGKMFQSVPGIGPELAQRIHDSLHVETLEQLEQAAHDGRLDRVPGIGARRTAAIRAALGERLGRRSRAMAPVQRAAPVDMLLDVDREYRERAAAGALRKIAPKRFNPTGEAWLPVLHAQRGDWRFTALYSNTANAHQLGKTRDWVVIYAHEDGDAEAQCTVVTETRGALRGRRVVRGRESESTTHYAGAAP
jgi:DNA polymerase (family X)